MTTDPKDPVLDTIKRRLKECEGQVSLDQSKINLLAEELTMVQTRKRKAQNEATNLRSHLDANYPGWDESVSE